MKKLIIASLIGVGLCGCEPPISGSFFTEHYITTYVIVDTVVLKPYYSNPNWIDLDFETGNSFCSEEEYRILTQRYGDTHYNRKKVPGDIALSEPITILSVTSDRDFGYSHPAGTPLNEFVKISCGSYYPFISSGYKWVENENGILSDLKTIRTYIDDPEAQEIELMKSYSCLLKLSGLPETDEEHLLTVTLRSGEKTIVSHIKYRFSKE